MTIYLGLLGLAVLIVVFILHRPDSNPVSPSHRESPSAPSANEEFQLLRRQTAILIKDKNLDAAEEKLAAMNALRPNDPAILSHSGAIETQRKNYPKARELYQAVLDENPNDYVAAYNLAEIEFVTKNFPEAGRRFRELVRNRSYNEALVFRIFLCEFLQGRVEAAKEVSIRFSRVGTTPAWYYANAALSRQANKDREADEYLSQARILYPSDAKFYDATYKRLELLETSSSSRKER